MLMMRTHHVPSLATHYTPTIQYIILSRSPATHYTPTIHYIILSPATHYTPLFTTSYCHRQHTTPHYSVHHTVTGNTLHPHYSVHHTVTGNTLHPTIQYIILKRSTMKLISVANRYQYQMEYYIHYADISKV